MKKIDKLLGRAKANLLYNEDVDFVVQRIKSASLDDPDLYTLIFILGLSGCSEHRSLVERFLHCREDPMLTRIALRTLCNYWGLGQDYLDELKMYIKGVDWDSGEVQLEAISSSGETMREHPERELIELILEVFDANYTDTGDEILVGASHDALSRIMDRSWNEIIAYNGKEIDPSIIRKSRELVEYIKAHEQKELS